MSDLRCDRVVELVTDFLDGALDAPTEQEVVEHLGGCDGCQAYVEQFRSTVETLHGLPPSALSPQARAELLEKFRQGA
jgi:anti-sigma factor RsiW